VAAVGGRLLDGAARVIIGQFFAALARQAGKEESGSFLKKRTKRLFPLEPGPSPAAHTKMGKVFCFFFSKKKAFLSRFFK